MFGVPVWVKRSLLSGLDFCVVSAGYVLALIDSFSLVGACLVGSFAGLAFCLLNYLFGVYRGVLRYSGFRILIKLQLSVWLVGFAIFVVLVGSGNALNPSDILELVFVTAAVGWAALLSRLLIPELAYALNGFGSHFQAVRPEKVLLYGAGNVGVQLLRAFRSDPSRLVVAFIDDSRKKIGREIDGLPIYDAADIREIVALFAVDTVVVSFAEVNQSEITKVLSDCISSGVNVSRVPSLSSLRSVSVRPSDLESVDVIDLLQRERIPPKKSLLDRSVFSKSVLVAGAGGSIGSEICRLALSLQPSVLVLVDNSEYALYRIKNDLCQQMRDMNWRQSSVQVVCKLTNICDCDAISTILKDYKVDTVYNAAAYKHVSLVEENPVDALKNNVMGTASLLKATSCSLASNFVQISTDKAVAPSNIMGASKWLCELLVESYAQKFGGKSWAVVRFGNVIASSGSVVPLFREQIARGGPVTVTSKTVTRYFMTITEAAQLVLQAGAICESFGIYILDMGEPIRIYDVASKLIELSGKSVRDSQNPLGDISIDVVGLRPGEKEHEVLCAAGRLVATEHPRIQQEFAFSDSNLDRSKTIKELESLIAENDINGLHKLVVEEIRKGGV